MSLEHKLNALEQLISANPSADRAERLRRLWKKTMLSENHDCFIVSGYPGEYEGVATTNLEITKMMSREVDAEIARMREEVAGSAPESRDRHNQGSVLCQNPAGCPLRQPIVFEIDAAPLQKIDLPVHREVSRFPAVSRDLSVIVPENVRIGAILDDLAVHKPARVVDIKLFDLYRGPGVENGKKSLAFRVLLQDTQKTMTDPEVESAVAQLVARLGGQFGGKLRD